MLGLIALTAATNAAGCFAIKQGRDAGTDLAVLGSLFYGASIMLIAIDLSPWRTLSRWHILVGNGHLSGGVGHRSDSLSCFGRNAERALDVGRGPGRIFSRQRIRFFLAGMFWFVFKQRRSTVIFLLAVIGGCSGFELAAGLVAWGLYLV